MKLFAYIDDALNAAHDLARETTNAILDRIDGFDNLPMPDIDAVCAETRARTKSITDKINWTKVNRDITGCPIDK